MGKPAVLSERNKVGRSDDHPWDCVFPVLNADKVLASRH
jgi:hypothetical protein